MSAKRLGRITAGLFVALGLAFGSAVAVSAGGSVPTAASTNVTVAAAQLDFDWV